MKIRYFPDTDTLYIALAERDSSSSEAISDNLIVDFDAQGRPVGLTVEHYSQISDKRQPTTLAELGTVTGVGVGVGQAKLERYGDAVLRVLQVLQAAG